MAYCRKGVSKIIFLLKHFLSTNNYWKRHNIYQKKCHEICLGNRLQFWKTTENMFKKFKRYQRLLRTLWVGCQGGHNAASRPIGMLQYSDLKRARVCYFIFRFNFQWKQLQIQIIPKSCFIWKKRKKIMWPFIWL